MASGVFTQHDLFYDPMDVAVSPDGATLTSSSL